MPGDLERYRLWRGYGSSQVHVVLIRKSALSWQSSVHTSHISTFNCLGFQKPVGSGRMYDDEHGRQRLRALARQFTRAGEFDQRRVVEVRFEVRSASHRVLPRADWSRFNATTPYLNIKPGRRGSDRFFLSAATPPRVPSRDGKGEVEVTPTTAIMPAFEVAQRFLVSIAIAGQGLFLWRDLKLAPYSLTACFENEDAPYSIDMEFKCVQYTQRPVLGAGFLAAGLDTMRCLHEQQFPLRFYEIYQRSSELLGAGIDPFGSFFEEAYLGFLRLLEFLVTAKILNCGGSLTKHRFEQAAAALGAKPRIPDGPKSIGNLLLKKRGTAVAHFQQGNVDDRVSVNDVKLVKDVLDITCCEYVLQKRGARG